MTEKSNPWAEKTSDEAQVVTEGLVWDSEIKRHVPRVVFNTSYGVEVTVTGAADNDVVIEVLTKVLEIERSRIAQSQEHNSGPA